VGPGNAVVEWIAKISMSAKPGAPTVAGWFVTGFEGLFAISRTPVWPARALILQNLLLPYIGLCR